MGLGFVLGLVAGLLNGSYAVPMKKTLKWAPENVWIIWLSTALLIFPWSIALVTVGDLGAVFANAGWGEVGTVFFYGILWGLGIVALGEAIAAVGISLSFAICLGGSIAVGSFVPMVGDPQIFGKNYGQTATAGIILLTIGVVICAIAGMRKDRQAKTQSVSEQSSTRTSYAKGITYCILSAILLSFINIGQAKAGAIVDAATKLGATAAAVKDPVWVVVLFGGFVVNALYWIVQLTKNKTWKLYRAPGSASHWFLGLLMGVLWMSSVALFGRAVLRMGDLGNSAGWALFMGTSILISSIWGILFGEWREGKGTPMRTMWTGLTVIIVSIALIGYANSLR